MLDLHLMYILLLDKLDNKNEEDGVLIAYPNNLPDGIRFRAGCTVNLRSEIGFKVRDKHLKFNLNSLYVNKQYV